MSLEKSKSVIIEMVSTKISPMEAAIEVRQRLVENDWPKVEVAKVVQSEDGSMMWRVTCVSKPEMADDEDASA